MTTLNLIYPGKSDIHFSSAIFPDGQPHLKIDAENISVTDKRLPVRILSRIANSNDLLWVLLAKNTLDYLDFAHVELDISFLMAARMDRVMQDGEPFLLKVVANMLNSGGFKKIRVFDPHSEVATALIDRSYPVVNHNFVKDAMADYLGKHPTSDYCLVSPDAGALKKIHILSRFLDVEEIVECFKQRDLRTGALSGFKTTAGDLSGKTCFIIDDICDGGGTFAGTAGLLKARGAEQIVLIVSHGIFSKGINVAGVDSIYCTDSYRQVDGISCYPIGDYL